MAKITRATIKSFVRKNRDNLYITVESRFDPRQDMVAPTDNNSWTKAEASTTPTLDDHTLGIRGVWLVGKSGNSFSPVTDPGYEGYNVSNCCGSFGIAIKKT